MQVLNSKISKPAISKTLMKETFFLKESMSVSFYSSAQFWMFSRQHEQYHRQSWQQQDRWSPRRSTHSVVTFSLLQNTTAIQYEYCFNIALLFGCMNVMCEKWMLILWKVSHKSIFFIKAWAFMLYGTMETLFNKIIRSWQSTNNIIFSVLYWTERGLHQWPDPDLARAPGQDQVISQTQWLPPKCCWGWGISTVQFPDKFFTFDMKAVS